jgi:hypothetical protein
MNQKVTKILFSAILVTAIFGCSNNQSINKVSPDHISPTPVKTNNVVEQTEKIKFRTEFGADLFALKQQANGAKLVDGNDEELAKMRENTPGKIKIKNPAEQVLGYVIREKGVWKLENQASSASLYTLKRENAAFYILEDAANQPIYYIKQQNNSWEVNTPNKNLVYQVRIRDGKTSLRNSSATTVFYTKSTISPIAFACFGLDVLTREQQAALAYAVNLTGGE